MRIALFAFAGALLVAGCSSNSAGDATVTPKMVKTGAARRVSTDILFSPFDRWVAPRTSSWRVGGFVGQTTTASLTSLQYYIQSISLCTDVTVMGTGYSGKSGCVDVYVNQASQSEEAYNNYAITQAYTDSDPTHFIDFLDPASVSTLEQPVAIASGTYNWALINFMRPIKIKAEFMQGSTAVGFTKATTAPMIADGGTDSGGRHVEYLRPTGTDTGPAETMTYMLNNGGTLFPFLQPFVVGTGDSVFVDFVFNPENFATMTYSPGCASATTQAVYDEGACNSFELPYAKMAPVPRKNSETTRKEVYRMEYVTGSVPQKSNARIEIYYNDADTAKSIRGVDVAIEMDSTATQGAMNVISSMKATEAANVVTLIGYNQTSGNIDGETLTGLTRGMTAGSTGTATLTCQFTAGPCTSVGETHVLNYTYVGDFAL